MKIFVDIPVKVDLSLIHPDSIVDFLSIYGGWYEGGKPELRRRYLIYYRGDDMIILPKNQDHQNYPFRMKQTLRTLSKVYSQLPFQFIYTHLCWLSEKYYGKR